MSVTATARSQKAPANFIAHIPIQADGRGQAMKAYEKLIQIQRHSYEFLVSQIESFEAQGKKLSPQQAGDLAELHKLIKLGWSLSNADTAPCKAETLIKRLQISLLPTYLSNELLIHPSEQAIQTFLKWVAFNQSLFGAFQSRMGPKLKNEGILSLIQKRFPITDKKNKNHVFALASGKEAALGSFRTTKLNQKQKFSLNLWQSSGLNQKQLNHLTLEANNRSDFRFFTRGAEFQRLAWPQLVPQEDSVASAKDLRLFFCEGRPYKGIFNARVFQKQNHEYTFHGLTIKTLENERLSVEIYSQNQHERNLNAAILTQVDNPSYPLQFSFLTSSLTGPMQASHFDEQFKGFLSPSLEVLSQLHRIFAATETIERSKRV